MTKDKLWEYIRELEMAIIDLRARIAVLEWEKCHGTRK
jgi:hypothetical protein